MKVEDFSSTGDQFCNIGKQHWSVSRLIDLSKDLEVHDFPIDALNISYQIGEDYMRIRDFAKHMQAVMRANLDYPIILDEDGELLDGRHRLVKAVLEKKKTVKAVRFDVNPLPCRMDD